MSDMTPISERIQAAAKEIAEYAYDAGSHLLEQEQIRTKSLSVITALVADWEKTTTAALAEADAEVTAPRHFGDPCIHCGIPHDDVPAGPCKRKPLAPVEPGAGGEGGGG